jgi:hypothetical protein
VTGYGGEGNDEPWLSQNWADVARRRGTGGGSKEKLRVWGCQTSGLGGVADAGEGCGGGLEGRTDGRGAFSRAGWQCGARATPATDGGSVRVGASGVE